MSISAWIVKPVWVVVLPISRRHGITASRRSYQLLQLPQHGRLLLLDLLPTSPGFAHPLIGNQVALEFPQTSVDRGSTQTAGRRNPWYPTAAE